MESRTPGNEVYLRSPKTCRILPPSSRRAVQAWLKGVSPGSANRASPVDANQAEGSTPKAKLRMIRTVAMLVFWGLAAPVAAVIGFPGLSSPGRYPPALPHVHVWSLEWRGLTGVRVKTIGLDKLDPACHLHLHVESRLQIWIHPSPFRLIPKRTSVMGKKRIVQIPHSWPRDALWVHWYPSDRGNRDDGIESVKAAKRVVRQGLNMTIYYRGKRSFDGKLLPFKKGPFYLAMECGVSRGPDHDHRHPLRHAQRQVRHQTRVSDRQFPPAHRAKRFR